MVTEACESGGGAGKEWGRFGKEEKRMRKQCR